MAGARHPTVQFSGPKLQGVTRRNAVGLVLAAPLASAAVHISRDLGQARAAVALQEEAAPAAPAVPTVPA